jgi:predicted transport protein
LLSQLLDSGLLNADRTLKWFFEEKVKENLHKWLSKLLSKSPSIIVVIEEKTQEVLEACKILTKSYDTKIIEFKTFQREDAPTVFSHLFEPIYSAEKVVAKEIVEGKRRALAERYRSWEKMLLWVDESTRDLVKELTTQISSLGEVIHKPVGSDYCFYRGNKPSSKSVFAAFLPRKSSLAIRIRTDPNTFKDPEKWVSDKIYKGWFFKQGQERTFDLKEKEQIAYAMELMKQSYDISGEIKTSLEQF